MLNRYVEAHQVQVHPPGLRLENCNLETTLTYIYNLKYHKKEKKKTKNQRKNLNKEKASKQDKKIPTFLKDNNLIRFRSRPAFQR